MPTDTWDVAQSQDCVTQCSGFRGKQHTLLTSFKRKAPHSNNEEWESRSRRPRTKCFFYFFADTHRRPTSVFIFYLENSN